MPRFLLYQITDLRPDARARLYIGAHICRDEHKCFANGVCTYMGSGTAITAAIKKHGLDCFKKDVLAELPSEEFLYRLEAAVVDDAFVARDDTYNLRVGGLGNTNPSSEVRARIRASLSGRKNGPHNEETKRKIGAALRGRTNHWLGVTRPPRTEDHNRHSSLANADKPWSPARRAAHNAKAKVNDDGTRL